MKAYRFGSGANACKTDEQSDCTVQAVAGKPGNIKVKVEVLPAKGTGKQSQPAEKK